MLSTALSRQLLEKTCFVTNLLSAANFAGKLYLGATTFAVSEAKCELIMIKTHPTAQFNTNV